MDIDKIISFYETDPDGQYDFEVVKILKDVKNDAFFISNKIIVEENVGLRKEIKNRIDDLYRAKAEVSCIKSKYKDLLKAFKRADKLIFTEESNTGLWKDAYNEYRDAKSLLIIENL